MPGILTIVQHTPWWVFALLALLIWLGSQALKPRTLRVWRLLITPVIFIGWGIASLALRSLSAPVLIVDWLVAAAVGAAIAWTTSRLDTVRIDRVQRLVTLPGSAWPLIRNLLIFSAKYAITATVTIAPASKADLAVWDIAISGASAGYFLGWLMRLALAYRRTPERGPAAQTQS
ncbi:MAG: DUF6622 family protein [Xanthobacteraceae bacterium]